VVIPTPFKVFSSDFFIKEIRSPQLCPSTNVFHTSSVHLSHSHRENVGGVGVWTGAATGVAMGTDVGEDVGANEGEAVGDDDGANEGEAVGANEGKAVGDDDGLALMDGELFSSSQVQVQISGNSSLTKRQAPASSKGPVVIPTPFKVFSSESFKKEIRSPQLCPSTNVFHTSSVHLSHSHREKVGGVGVWTGAATGVAMGV